MNTTLDDGGSAFPVAGWESPNHGWIFGNDGMSLRDWLIGMSIAPVIQTAIHQGVTLDFEEIAINAGRIADAVIATRKEAK